LTEETRVNQDVTNPGTINVADQGDGLITVDQPVSTGPSSSSGPLVSASNLAPGRGTAAPDQPVSTGPSSSSGPLVAAPNLAPGLGTATPDQPVTVGPPQVAGRTVDGVLASPQSPETIDVIENDVVGQVYGQGTPTNVFV
jgi:hypothetical protein